MTEWNTKFEDILKESADKAQFYNWTHLKSYRRYSIINKFFMSVVIIISTISGSINLSHILDTYSSTIPLGIANIMVAIIVLIYQTLKIPEMSQEHKGSARAGPSFTNI